MRSAACLLVALCVAMSCSSSNDSDAPTTSDISTTYVDIAQSGFIDQTVTFENRANVAVIPRTRYRALDGDGNAVGGIEVTTAFGSDRSLLVVPPTGYFDVLTFTGVRVDEVADVEIEVVDVVPVAGYNLGEGIEPEALDGDGASVSKFDAFSQIGLANPSDADIRYRVVCLIYDVPKPGNAQQAIDVSVAIESVLVPAGERVIAPVTESFAERTANLGYGCDSLKAHPTVPAT